MINLNVLNRARHFQAGSIFFSSSACVYPKHNQEDPNAPVGGEESVCPANPDKEYGREKLFSERLYLAHNRQFAMNCRVARYHHIFGPFGPWQRGREKAPAAICRKVAEARDGSSNEIRGDGNQTRSLLLIAECIEATRRMMRSGFPGPMNIGSQEMISINDLAKTVIGLSGKRLTIENISGPAGVRGRNSDNRLISEMLGWAPSAPLHKGIARTFAWVRDQVELERATALAN